MAHKTSQDPACSCMSLGIRYFSWLYTLKEHQPCQRRLPKETYHDHPYKFVTLSLTLLYFSPYHDGLSNIQENKLMAVREVVAVIADCFSSTQELTFCEQAFLQFYLLQHPPDFETYRAHNKHAMHTYCLNQIDRFSSWRYIPYSSFPRLRVGQQKWTKSHRDCCHQVCNVIGNVLMSSRNEVYK